MTNTGDGMAGLAVDGTTSTGAAVERILRRAREHLGLEVAFVGRFDGETRVIRNVDGPPEVVDALTGHVDEMSATYCALVARGEVSVVPDVSQNPDLRDMAVTAELGVASYAGTPIYLSNGDIYGTLCCYSTQLEPSLNQRDSRTLEMLASLLAERIEAEEFAVLEARAGRERIQDLIGSGEPQIVFQPIVDLSTGFVSGYEALSRFHVEPRQAPDVWFAAAERVGMGAELEVKALQQALAHMPAIPADQYVSINLSAATLCHPLTSATLADVTAQQVVIEITEHALHEDRDELAAAMSSLRERGFRFALDDLGSGHAGLERVLRLAPEIIKLDRALITSIDADPARRALVSATVTFAASVGACVVAEGVETVSECNTVRDLGVSHVQGYFLARPAQAPWETLGAQARLIAPALPPVRRANIRAGLGAATVAVLTYMLTGIFDLAERLQAFAPRVELIELDELPVTLAALAIFLAVVTIRRAAAFQRQLDERREAQQRLQHANAELWRLSLSRTS